MSTFCLTGNSALSSISLKIRLQDAGHTVRNSVSSDVDYVVLLESPAAAKIKNAKLLDIEFWDEEQLIEFLVLQEKCVESEIQVDSDTLAVTAPEVTVLIPVSELKRWAQLAGEAINPTVIFVRHDMEGMMAAAMDKADESIKELNESIHGVLDGRS